MNSEAALIFFDAVKQLEKLEGRQITREERVMILMEMAKMGYVDSVMETNRTEEEVLRDSAKNFGQVLHLKEDGTAEIIKPESTEDEDDLSKM
jgi:hypothetical protein